MLYVCPIWLPYTWCSQHLTYEDKTWAQRGEGNCQGHKQAGPGLCSSRLDVRASALGGTGTAGKARQPLTSVQGQQPRGPGRGVGTYPASHFNAQEAGTEGQRRSGLKAGSLVDKSCFRIPSPSRLIGVFSLGASWTPSRVLCV